MCRGSLFCNWSPARWTDAATAEPLACAILVKDVEAFEDRRQLALAELDQAHAAPLDLYAGDLEAELRLEDRARLFVLDLAPAHALDGRHGNLRELFGRQAGILGGPQKLGEEVQVVVRVSPRRATLGLTIGLDITIGQ